MVLQRLAKVEIRGSGIRRGIALLLSLVSFAFAGILAAEQHSTPLITPDPASPEVTPELRSIEWPRRQSLQKTARAGLSPQVLLELDSASLPVLLPPQADILKQLSIRVSGPFYSASLEDKERGIWLFITGSRLAFVPPADSTLARTSSLNDSVRDVPASAYQSEGIWNLTWEQYGAAYLIKLDCNSSVTTLCGDDTYLRSMAETLVVMGGAGVAQEGH